MKLIENWKESYKLLTVKIGAFLSAFFTLLIFFSDHLVTVWNQIPQAWKDQIPETWGFWIGGIVSVAMVLARLKSQPKLQQQPLGFVTVTAGHSNVDPGAVNGKYKEAELVTNFRNAVNFYLNQAGIKTRTDGIGSKNEPLSSAVKLIKGSSVAVEFHLNAAGSSQANGIETIALPADKLLAQKLSNAVGAALGSRVRGQNGWIDQSDSARGKLAFVSGGGLILELGFISNQDELARFNARYWLAARAVANVLIEHEKGN